MSLETTPTRDRQGKAVPTVTWQSAWGTERILVLLTLGLFILYGTFRAFENNLYDTTRMATATFADGVIPHYLSPFYSPPIQNWFKLPGGISAALFLLAFPGSFRFTCYFCRRTYYRAIFGTPPACAAREVMQRSNYTGEKEFPWTVQNLHRYTLYFILIFVAFHWYHLFEALRFVDASGGHRFGIGLGTFVFGLDTVFLSLYVFSCHSFRHLIGGIVNRFSSSPARHSMWAGVSKLNERHGLFFWLSLITVGLADIYVRSVCAGMIPDVHILF